MTIALMLAASQYSFTVENTLSNATMRQRKPIQRPSPFIMGQDEPAAAVIQPTSPTTTSDQPSFVMRCLGVAEISASLLLLCSYSCIKACYQKTQSYDENSLD